MRATPSRPDVKGKSFCFKSAHRAEPTTSSFSVVGHPRPSREEEEFVVAAFEPIPTRDDGERERERETSSARGLRDRHLIMCARIPLTLSLFRHHGFFLPDAHVEQGLHLPGPERARSCAENSARVGHAQRGEDPEIFFFLLCTLNLGFVR